MLKVNRKIDVAVNKYLKFVWCTYSQLRYYYIEAVLGLYSSVNSLPSLTKELVTLPRKSGEKVKTILS